MNCTAEKRTFGLARPSLILAVGLVLSGCTAKAPEATAAESEAASAPQPAEAADGGTYALVTYPVGKQAPADFAGQVNVWKAEGKVEDVLVLRKRGKQLAETGYKSAGFEYLAVVEFPAEQQYTDWVASAKVTLGNEAVIRRADRLVHEETNPRNAAKAYYAVNHYEALISLPEYKTYTEAYIVPNMENQKNSGVLTSYTMFLEREEGGARSKAVLIKEYQDEDAFARSEPIKEEYKKVLLRDPEWSRINDTKATLRTDLNETLAKQVPLQ